LLRVFAPKSVRLWKDLGMAKLPYEKISPIKGVSEANLCNFLLRVFAPKSVRLWKDLGMAKLPYDPLPRGSGNKDS
jgi:hypothetical protein